MASFDTTSNIEGNTYPVISPYSEVGGIGVVIGFASTTFLTVIVLVVNYLVSFDPRAYSLTQLGDAQAGDVRVNLFDEWILSARALVRRWLPECLLPPGKGPAKRANWWQYWIMNGQEREKLGKVFEKLILRLCDGHFIAGYTFLIGGFISVWLERGQSHQEQMSFYHWKILLDIAWYSASTHLAGFVFLNRYFADRPVQLTFRILSVGVFVALVILASLPKMDSQLNDWDPVLVFWENAIGPQGLRGFLSERNRSDGWENFNLTLISMFLMVSHFIIRALETLSRAAPQRPIVRLRRLLSGLASNVLSWLWQEGGGCLANWWNQAFVRPLIVVFLVGRLYCDLYQSTAVKVLATVLVTCWGSISLFQTRFNNYLSPIEDNKWAFGQISAVIASAIPIFATILSLCRSLDKASEPDIESKKPDPEPTVATSPAHQGISRSSTWPRLDVPSIVYRANRDTQWRPWASSLALLYAMTAIIQAFDVFAYSFVQPGLAWTALRFMMTPYLVAQWPIVVLYALYASALEASLNQLHWARDPGRRRAAWMLANGAVYLGFGFLIFCSISDRSPIWICQLGVWMALSLGLTSFQAFPCDVHWSRRHWADGLLWRILFSAVILYELVCLLVCFGPLVWSGNSVIKEEKEQPALPQWRAPRAASWPARQAWRDGQYGVQRCGSRE